MMANYIFGQRVTSRLRYALVERLATYRSLLPRTHLSNGLEELRCGLDRAELHALDRELSFPVSTENESSATSNANSLSIVLILRQGAGQLGILHLEPLGGGL